MLIGAHVSTRGGIDKAVDNALAVAAPVIQTHPTAPQTWRQLRLDPGMIAKYQEKAEASALQRHYFHAVYLINLASADEKLIRNSVESLLHYMELADQIKADGVIFHPGSHRGLGFEQQLPTLENCLKEVLGRTDSQARLIVENSAGAGGCVGCNLQEVGAIIEGAGGDPRIGVCLDTCHAFTSGYDLTDEAGRGRFIDEFEKFIGVGNLVLVHANDSKTELGSNRDRHANIGEGNIGDDAFAKLLEMPELSNVPWVLETPGDGEGPRLQDVNQLRGLAKLPPLQAGSFPKA